jgi:hypothetical protein
MLKKQVRKNWERENPDVGTYVWGMDCTEEERAEGIREAMPMYKHVFPLIDAKISKEEAHRILNATGIKRPMMYDLGYHNNNCIGCIKGGAGYWNKIRVDFPEVFAERAKLERKIGRSCINGVYLDELELDAGRHEGPICDDCGIMCEIMKVKP